MTVTRRLAVAATALALMLSGCALPGQEAAPGTAAILNDHVVTNGDIEAMYALWVSETRGIDIATRNQVLTAELMRPRALEKVKELGITLELELIGAEWMRHTRFQGQLMGDPDTHLIPDVPPDDLLKAIEGVAAIAILARHPDGAPWLIEFASEVEQDAIVSPRYGAFNAEEFIASIVRVESVISERSMQAVFFVEFQHVNGVYPIDKPWLTN